MGSVYRNILIFPHCTDPGITNTLIDLVMPETDSSSDESSYEINARFNDMAMPETDSELSAEDTPQAPNAPSQPNHGSDNLAMPDTDSNDSDDSRRGSEPAEDQMFDPSLAMPNTDSQSDSSVVSERSAHSEQHLSQSEDPNRQFGEIEGMSGSE